MRLFLCKDRRTDSDFTGAVPAGNGGRGMVDSTDMTKNKNVASGDDLISGT